MKLWVKVHRRMVEVGRNLCRGSSEGHLVQLCCSSRATRACPGKGTWRDSFHVISKDKDSPFSLGNHCKSLQCPAILAVKTCFLMFKGNLLCSCFWLKFYINVICIFWHSIRTWTGQCHSTGLSDCCPIRIFSRHCNKVFIKSLVLLAAWFRMKQAVNLQ